MLNESILSLQLNHNVQESCYRDYILVLRLRTPNYLGTLVVDIVASMNLEKSGFKIPGIVRDLSEIFLKAVGQSFVVYVDYGGWWLSYYRGRC